MSYVSFCYILEQTRILKYWQTIRLTAFSYDAHLVSDGQKLRTLELNSWQILRLLQAQIPDFCLEDCIDSADDLGIDVLPESVEKKLCYFISKAFTSHQSSRLHRGSDLM